MIEFFDFSGTRVCSCVTRFRTKILACNVVLHDDCKRNSWSMTLDFTYRKIWRIFEKYIDCTREALELVENYGFEFRAKRDRHVKYLYMAVHGQRDSAESNLKFDNALLRAGAYSPGSRELLLPDRPVRGRITYYLISRCRWLRVWSCVFFAIARQYNFVANRTSLIIPRH